MHHRLLLRKEMVADHLYRWSILFRYKQEKRFKKEDDKKDSKRGVRYEWILFDKKTFLTILSIRKSSLLGILKSEKFKEEKFFRSEFIININDREINFYNDEIRRFSEFLTCPGSSVEEQKPSKLKVVGSIPPLGTIDFRNTLVQRVFLKSKCIGESNRAMPSETRTRSDQSHFEKRESRAATESRDSPPGHHLTRKYSLKLEGVFL